MRDLIELRHRLGKLVDALRLFPRGGGNLVHQRIDFHAVLRNLIEHLGHFGRDLHAIAGRADRFFDHLCRGTGRLGRTVRQIAHLFGDHGKALARLAGAGGLDRRVERQQVRLEGDFVDHLQHFGRLRRRLLDVMNSLAHLLHRSIAALGGGLGLTRKRTGVTGRVRVTLDHRRKLLDGGAGLFQTGGLFAGALGQRLAGRGYFSRTVGHAGSRLIEVCNLCPDRADHRTFDEHIDAECHHHRQRHNVREHLCQTRSDLGLNSLGSRLEQKGPVDLTGLPVLHGKTEMILAVLGRTHGRIAMA